MMSRVGKQRRTFGTAIVQYFGEKPRAFKDLMVVISIAVGVFAVSARFDVFNTLVEWMYRHDTWQLDELFTVALYLVFAIAIYAWRRHHELVDQTRRREMAEAEKAQLAPRLERALADVSHLKKLLPMCSVCKRVRDDKGYWDQVEAYVEVNFSTRVDTGICPDCAANLYRSARTVRSRSGGT
jgi:Ca2+/Na+ antiporter